MLLGVNPLETLIMVLVMIAPLAVGLYLLRLLVRFLKLSIGEMEERQRLRAEHEPAVAARRQTLAKSLRELREGCGMTQEFVAQQLGVSRQAVSKWETGASDPSTTNLIALAELYATDPVELIRSISQARSDG